MVYGVELWSRRLHIQFYFILFFGSFFLAVALAYRNHAGRLNMIQCPSLCTVLSYPIDTMKRNKLLGMRIHY